MTPLVFLPGMMCDARLFAPQISTLSGAVPLMTMPLAQRETMAGFASDILSCAPDKFALAGLSMGGIVAMEVLRQAPERVLGIALMDTNPLAELDEVKQRRGPQMTAAVTGELNRIMRDEMIPNYLADPESNPDIIELCKDMATGLGPDVFIRQSKALRDRIDQTETLKKHNGPSLVLCGREDKLCPISRHQMMHELLPHSSLEIIENAGHMPTLEQPEETTAILSRWLEDL
ncbi:alpha/beta hydrolase [Kiloniella spongiae]|uniref:Alpha/beta hydrolase n=1 Tax=Kiloniella spongiae TaxID=1489064 RepID=A0A0H2MBD3_9PROT|nr:alpha/beta hydrolase [Kiloniella spongiae]KLN59869.1 alpha/beta hydrolase [Kiloniella spongiae]